MEAKATIVVGVRGDDAYLGVGLLVGTELVEGLECLDLLCDVEDQRVTTTVVAVFFNVRLDPRDKEEAFCARVGYVAFCSDDRTVAGDGEDVEAKRDGVVDALAKRIGEGVLVVFFGMEVEVCFELHTTNNYR